MKDDILVQLLEKQVERLLSGEIFSFYLPYCGNNNIKSKFTDLLDKYSECIEYNTSETVNGISVHIKKLK